MRNCDPGESFLFPQPIKRYEVSYRQQFSSYGGDYWMPVDFRSDILAEINMPGLLSFPAFRLNHVARFTDYQVNVAVPEELYSEERSLVLDSAAVEAGAVFEEPGMVVPLTADETAAYDKPGNQAGVRRRVYARRTRGPYGAAVRQF